MFWCQLRLYFTVMEVTRPLALRRIYSSFCKELAGDAGLTQLGILTTIMFIYTI